MRVEVLRRAGAAVAAGVLSLGASLALPAAPAAAAAAGAQPTWHADQARVAEARGAGREGEGVVVAVLDSWVDAAHPDLAGRVLPGVSCTSGSCLDGPPVADACTHGTHVAGTVASSSYGVAPRALVLPVQVLSYDAASAECIGRPVDVAAGIRWAVGRGARVVNLSLGADVTGGPGGSSALPVAVEEAARAGVVVVLSGGNVGRPVADSYGAAALVVAATGPGGTLASYSQQGPGIDLAAPGGDPVTPDQCTPQDCVVSLFPGGGYAVAAGTSMAAPLVAGIAALLVAQDPARTPDQVVARLVGTARPLPGAGAGLVDAAAALAVPTAPAPEPAGVPLTSPAPEPPPVSSAAPVIGAPAEPVDPLPLPPAPDAVRDSPPPAASGPAPSLQPAATPGGGEPARPGGPFLVAALLVLLAGAATGGVTRARRRP